MKTLELVHAGESDIPAITELAARIWNQHYPAIISRAQIDYMLELMYSNESLKTQLKEKDHRFYFIEQDKKRLGFIAVEEMKDRELFIHKYYVDQDVAGKGIGTKAFEELLRIYQSVKIRLTVNRQNSKAINFYFGLGFRIERIADFDIGNGFVMNDFVMMWQKI